MSNQLISADVIRLLYKVVQDVKVGETLVLAYESKDSGCKGHINLLLINENTKEYIEYTDIMYEDSGSLYQGIFQSTLWCRKYKNLIYIYCKNELHIVDINKTKEIKSYTNVYGCYSLNNGKIIGLRFRFKVIMYSVIENKELCNEIASEIIDRDQYCYMDELNEDYIKICDGGYGTMLFSIRENKILYKDHRITDLQMINNDRDIIFCAEYRLFTSKHIRNMQKVVIYDVINHIETYSTEYGSNYKMLSRKNIVIRVPDKILIYSVFDRKITQEIEAKGTAIFSNIVRGKSTNFICFNTCGILFDKNDNILRIFNYNNDITAVNNSRSYCDLMILNMQNNKIDYLDKNNHFIHKNNIFTLEEFLEYLTIKEITPKYKGNGKVDYYAVLNNKGLTGTISPELNTLRYKGILHGENILTDRFDYFKKTYLV